MSAKRDEILDAAERLIRERGYSGFSFRDIAAEVQIKSASVHYHFATKSDLAVAVAKRYREQFETALKQAEETGQDRVSAWRDLFYAALKSDGLMCLCGILVAEGSSLPPSVSSEASEFMRFGIQSLDEVRTGQGTQILSQLEGAMLVARSTNDVSLFLSATDNLV